MDPGRRTCRFDGVINKSMRITNEEELRKFVHDVDGFHDALLHELVMLHPGYVSQDRTMFGDSELPNVKMIFQSQFPDIFAVQLNLVRVSKFRFDPSYEFQLECELEDGAIIIYPSGKRLSTFSEIRAAEAEYVMLGEEFLGPKYGFTS
jgi:hypothetical protein